MFTLRLRPRPMFAGLVPASLVIGRLLNTPPYGANVIALPIKLKGPKLMWGHTWHTAVATPKPKAARVRARLKKLMLNRYVACFALVWLAAFLFLAAPVVAQGFPSIKPSIVERAETPEDVTSSIELLLLLTVLSLAPGILVMTTAFTRIVVVFGFLRLALSTQQLPPSQVLTGLALILTFLVMRPTITEIKDKALVPYLDAQITQQEAFNISVNSLRDFMFSQVAESDMNTFGELSGVDPEKQWKTYGDIDTLILVPAFVTSELKRGFYMGFMLYLPFLIIDLVVATVLISMGMLVLPPVMVSLPFKILLFVLVDGWTLVVVSLVKSFHGPVYGAGP